MTGLFDMLIGAALGTAADAARPRPAPRFGDAEARTPEVQLAEAGPDLPLVSASVTGADAMAPVAPQRARRANAAPPPTTGQPLQPGSVPTAQLPLSMPAAHPKPTQNHRKTTDTVAHLRAETLQAAPKPAAVAPIYLPRAALPPLRLQPDTPNTPSPATITPRAAAPRAAHARDAATAITRAAPIAPPTAAIIIRIGRIEVTPPPAPPPAPAAAAAPHRHAGITRASPRQSLDAYLAGRRR